MNALQIIPPKPATAVRRSALSSRILDAIILVALASGMSLLRGEEGTASEPGAAIVVTDGRSNVGGNDKSPTVTPPAAAPAATAGVTNDTKASSEAEQPAVAEAESIMAASAAINDRNGSRALAKRSTSARAPVASNNGLAPKREDARAPRAPDAVAARPAESAPRAYAPRGEVDYRGWKSADRAPVWVGPPPVIYGTGPAVRAPYVVGPAQGMKRQDRMSLATMTGWVVEAPGAVLNGGKQALYGILDTVW